MIKIRFQEKTFHIPSQWSDIQLSEYEQWFGQKPVDKRDYVNIVSRICKIDEDFLLESSPQFFESLGNTIDFIFKTTDMEPSDRVQINGTNYFVVMSDAITLGEWVDVEAIIESESQTKISDILSIMCRPAGELYDAKQGDERKTIFRQLTCDKALPLLSFFLYKKQESEAILNHYSTLRAQADQFLKDIKDFAASGDGIKQLPIWRRIKYIYLIKLLEKRLSKFSASCSIR